MVSRSNPSDDHHASQIHDNPDTTCISWHMYAYMHILSRCINKRLDEGKGREIASLMTEVKKKQQVGKAGTREIEEQEKAAACSRPDPIAAAVALRKKYDCIYIKIAPASSVCSFAVLL